MHNDSILRRENICELSLKVTISWIFQERIMSLQGARSPVEIWLKILEKLSKS